MPQSRYSKLLLLNIVFLVRWAFLSAFGIDEGQRDSLNHLGLKCPKFWNPSLQVLLADEG